MYSERHLQESNLLFADAVYSVEIVPRNAQFDLKSGNRYVVRSSRTCNTK